MSVVEALNLEESVGGLDIGLKDDTIESKSGIIYIEDDYEDEDAEDDVTTEEGILSKEEQLKYFEDKVISSLVGGKGICSYASKILTLVNPAIFRDENYVIFSVLAKYRSKLKHLKIDEEFLSLYLDNNRELLEKSQGFIDIHAYGEVDGSDTVGYISGVIKHFRRLSGFEDMSPEDFDLVFEKYIILFKALEARRIYVKSSMILSEGVKVGSKNLVGFDDSVNYSKRKLAELEGLVDMNSGSGFKTMSEIMSEDKSSVNKKYLVADFDKLEALNKVYGGIYSGNFYSVVAPTKAGKSKFCARLCHTASVKFGTNVTVWPEEGGSEAWTAQIRAIHFDHVFNEGVSVTDRKYGIDMDVIVNDNYPDDSLRELELTSSLDLRSNPEYGVVDTIDRPFNVETFLDDIDTSVKANGSSLIIIDYLQLIGSSNPRMSERERVAKAYQDLLKYCRKNNVAVITPAQYKQDAIDKLGSMSSTDEFDPRTAGGVTSEVFRTPDVIFAFWASVAQLRNNSLKILSAPSRLGKAFPEIPCYIDLAVCQFVSIDGD